MSSSIHLFKLAQLNSEIKYILHSISRKAPPYAYPNIPDILQWQNDMIARLERWYEQIPQFTGHWRYMTLLCEIKYHGVAMLLLRPSPAIPTPSIESVKSCYESSISSLRLYDQLYKADMLVYSWVTVHSIFLTTITMLHCIWTLPEASGVLKLDVLMADLKTSSNVLSATSEHWSEAKGSRDVLDELSGTTVRWVIESRARSSETERLTENAERASGHVERASQITEQPTQSHNSQLSGNYGPTRGINLSSGLGIGQDNQYFDSDFYSSLFGSTSSLTDQIDFSNIDNVNAMMHGVFTDFQPVYNFGQDFDMDQIMNSQP